MKTILIKGSSGQSKIITGAHINMLHEYLPQKRLFIITDKNVHSLFHAQFPISSVFIISPGEQSKSFATLNEIYLWLMQEGADRESFIVGIGGGVVCDITGFIATTFMRGISFGFVASSLLAQVDASVGGKNGINLNGYKNIVGTFSLPEFVICDISLLPFLPADEFANGMAEIIKHAILADAPQFSYLEKNHQQIRECEPKSMDYLVSQSIQIKSDIVQSDEKENGRRKLLNLGHTWGHAIEKAASLPHGQAVSIGLAFAARFSEHKGYLANKQVQRIIDLLSLYKLPVSHHANPENILEALLFDKKKQNDQIHFIFIKDIGEPLIEKIPINSIREYVTKHYIWK